MYDQSYSKDGQYVGVAGYHLVISSVTNLS
jgi:hypothetical protein